MLCTVLFKTILDELMMLHYTYTQYGHMTLPDYSEYTCDSRVIEPGVSLRF
jgi:hypothetical protein